LQTHISYVVCVPQTDNEAPSTHDDTTLWEAAGVITLLATKSVPSTSGQAQRSESYVALELGYLFIPEVWGKGFATESLAAVLDAYRGAAVTMGLPQDVRADVHALNKGSLRVMEKLGFKRVCVLS
jgi:GNAT superfamily N-acetyltransferase